MAGHEGARDGVNGSENGAFRMNLQRSDTPTMRALRRFRSHKLAMAGLVVISVMAVLSIGAPLFAAFDPYQMDVEAFRQPPTAKHILGTDLVGRDQWSRVLHGGRVSLAVGLISVSIYMTIGFVLGGLSGLLGGKTDMLVMRFTDLIMCFPGLVIILILVTMLGPSLRNVMLALGLLSWPGIARLVRGQVLSLREQDFITAARAIGAQNERIIFQHLLPNIIGPMTVAATFGISGAILTEAGLSFLGFGVRPPTPSWGLMINEARGIAQLGNMPWMWIPPGAAISMAVLAINFIGDGLRDAFDVRSRLEG